MEAHYFAFGDYDYFLVLDLPDNVTTAAVTLVTNASGTIKNRTTVLMTSEEMDQAVDKAVNAATGYRPPGQ